MIPGQLLEMLADDPGAEADMKIWAHVAGYELTQVARDGAVFRFLVRKTG
jgi:TusA-related sulfurtransferase